MERVVVSVSFNLQHRNEDLMKILERHFMFSRIIRHYSCTTLFATILLIAHFIIFTYIRTTSFNTKLYGDLSNIWLFRLFVLPIHKIEYFG